MEVREGTTRRGSIKARGGNIMGRTKSIKPTSTSIGIGPEACACAKAAALVVLTEPSTSKSEGRHSVGWKLWVFTQS